MIGVMLFILMLGNTHNPTLTYAWDILYQGHPACAAQDQEGRGAAVL
jgi:hypothetical protein